MSISFEKSDSFALLEINTEAPDTAPEWIELIPAGDFVGRDKRAFKNTEVDTVIAEFLQNQMDIPIDIEHASQLKAKNGDPAPAVGWIKELQNRLGKLVARVEWTAEGKNLINSKQYRGISPAFLVDSATRVIKRLVSAGLTNQPNLFIPALNNEGNMTHEMTLTLQQEKLALQTELNQAKTEITRLQTELNAQLELVKQQQTSLFTAELNTLLAKYADRVYPAIEKEIREEATDWFAAKGAEIALNRVENGLKRLQAIGKKVDLDPSLVNGTAKTELNAMETEAIHTAGCTPEFYEKAKALAAAGHRI